MSDGITTSSADIAGLPASALIETFGGVRPLAKKLDLAASTVQGWKLRDHIPESYHHRLQNLIQEESLDLAHLLPGDNSATVAATPAADTAAATASPVTPSAASAGAKPVTRPMAQNPNNAYFAMPQATMRYWVMSSLATIGLMSLLVLILTIVFFGRDIFDYATNDHAQPVLAEAVPAPEPQPAAEPAPDSVQSDLQQSREAIDDTLDSVQKIRDEASPDQTALVAQIDRIENVVGGLRDKVDQLDKTLQEKGVDAGAIRQQMSEISRRDVLAAALLLGVAQIHGMLDQQADFSQDLVFLKALMANDPQMVKSLDKLGPFAEKGLMTREQILETLDMVGKETIKINQVQPHLSWSEKLMQAFGNVVEIRKKDADAKTRLAADPTTPQGQIAKAKELVADDDFAMAAQILQSYQGPQAAHILEVAHNLQGRDAATQVLDDLLQKSQQMLSVDQIKSLMGQNPLGASTTSAPGGLY